MAEVVHRLTKIQIRALRRFHWVLSVILSDLNGRSTFVFRIGEIFDRFSTFG